MCKFFIKNLIAVFLLVVGAKFSSVAQNSILVNLGSATCDSPYSPAFSLIGNPLTASPSVFALCDMSKQLPNYNNVFIAYNPLNNKVYVDDDRNPDTSKVWILDVGLPESITCPPVIPVIPTYYLLHYSTSYFEFDNNGNIFSLSNYDPNVGTCNLDRLDVTTGTVLATQVLQFPAGNFPNVFGNGDITILPNGRMFVVLGIFPSQLYEITNYSDTSSTPTVNYLQSMPANTFGMAYLNGQLEITGTDGINSCYYYNYDIGSNTLGPQNKFQAGQLPIDNSSITPAIGVTKQLLNKTFLNTTTADITYEIYVRNMGNVILNNINATDNLGAIYGAANVSNVSVSFEPDGNDAGLILNNAYNGTTDTNILLPGQNLPNQILNNTNYFFKVLVQCRVSNFYSDITYYNSAIGSGTIGNGSTTINVSDSSNDGPPSAVDPNNDGNANEPGENTPTPFHYVSPTSTPVHFINVTASSNDNSSVIKWSVAIPTVDASKFEVEYSINGINWKTVTQINITNQGQSNYQYTQQDVPTGNAFYRIKEIDDNSNATYSRIVALNNSGANSYIISPNPANNTLQINVPYGTVGNSIAELYDATGRKLIDVTIASNITAINTSQLPDGAYLLRIQHDDAITTQKVLIVH